MPEPENTIISQITDEAYEALVAKGVHVLLFPLVKESTGIKADTAKNLLKGWPIGSFTGSGETADSEEYQDQLIGGIYKTFISGGLDPGDINLKTYFNPDVGKPDIAPVKHSRTITPQFVLMLATTCDEPEQLEVWWSGGVNYLGGGGINGDYGKVIGSELKFKVSGAVKVGKTNNGKIPKSLYG